MRLRAALFVVIWLPLTVVALEGGEKSAEVDTPIWLTVPDAIREEQVLWTGPLERYREVPTEGGRDAQAPAPGEVKDAQLPPRKAEDAQLSPPGPILTDVPVVSIGRPEIWPLLRIYPYEEMPLLMQAQLQEADFYLIRLFCSFRPTPRQTRVGWARFHVFLRPDAMGRQPIAYDLSPLEISQEVKRQLTFTLAPTLKFQSVGEVGVGSVGFRLDHPELQPIIIGAGIGEATPTWDYKIATGIQGVQGTKWMYLLVKAPKDMRQGTALLDLTAQVFVDSFWAWVPYLLPPEVRKEYLTIPLWP